MESENSLDIGKRKKTVTVIAGVFAVFLLYYALMAMLAPFGKISEINRKFGFRQPENETIDERIFSDSAFIKLNRDKAFYQSRISMAETDSICLALNLSDSTAKLEINGVTVHSAKISRIRASKILRKADEYAVSSMLTTPFTVTRNYATLKKEPVMLKVAPKDTSEFKPDILPDTTNTKAVNYMLEMDNGFRLYVYQETGADARNGLNRFLFDLSDRFRNSWHIIKGMFTFRVPEYHPSIKIRLPKADARIIYRGLPRQGQIALFR